MPGYRECTVIDANDSRWTLKVGVGGLVRTVKVLVHVDEWHEPARVNFSYTLEGDPVQGSGSYTALQKSAEETEVALRVTRRRQWADGADVGGDEPAPAAANSQSPSPRN